MTRNGISGNLLDILSDLLSDKNLRVVFNVQKSTAMDDTSLFIVADAINTSANELNNNLKKDSNWAF